MCIFAWRAATTAALGALVSSKINQWTLLVAMLPLIYAISAGGLKPLPLEGRQRDEVLLTAAPSLFAVALLLDLRLSLSGAAMIVGLFAVQFVFPEARREFALVYVVLAALTVLLERRRAFRAFRAAEHPERSPRGG